MWVSHNKFINNGFSSGFLSLSVWLVITVHPLSVYKCIHGPPLLYRQCLLLDLIRLRFVPSRFLCNCIHGSLTKPDVSFQLQSVSSRQHVWATCKHLSTKNILTLRDPLGQNFLIDLLIGTFGAWPVLPSIAATSPLPPDQITFSTLPPSKYCNLDTHRSILTILGSWPYYTVGAQMVGGLRPEKIL